MGLHTGEPLAAPPKYVGMDVHKAARIMSAGHGGQVLVSSATKALLDGIELTHLGEYRLKDLLQPEALYQLHIPGLPAEFPALKTLGNRPTNLPVQPSPLVGRDDEVQRVSDLLADPEVRLLTLTGPGGIGKTRLALQVGAELLDAFASGIFFVSLAAVDDPALVIHEVAQTLAVREQPGEEIVRTVTDYLERKQMLIVLDNFEQVVDAAPGLSTLLERCGELKLLVTSRERLGVRTEREHEVPPLGATEAADLFVTLARRFDERFEPDEHVAEIARRLDGLPLALELAAARVKVLTPREINERLGSSLDLLTAGARDAPERHRTLRATIRWSCEQLSSHEQDTFVRLSTFTGSFELDAAAVVANADVEVMSSLLDKSLVRRTQEGRFFLLETIRQFGAEELEHQGATSAVFDAHARYYLGLARELSTPPFVALEKMWGDRFLLEEPQLRTALATFRSHGRVAQLQEMCALLWHTWDHFGRLAEGRAQIEVALETPSDDRGRGALLEIGLSVLAWRQGDGAAALAAADRAVSVLRDVDDRRLLTHGLRTLSNAHYLLNDFASADLALAESAELARASGDVVAECYALVNRGALALGRGDNEAVLQLAAAATDLAAAHALVESAAVAHHNAGTAHFRLGDLERAEESFKASLLVYGGEIGPWRALFQVDSLAAVAARRSDFEHAARLLGGASRICDETGIAFDGPQLELHEEALAATVAALGADTYAESLVEGAGLSLEELVDEALGRRPRAPRVPQAF
jgi:predicted ATPase